MLPRAELPPRYVPPVPDDEEEEGDTLVEGLERDSFDARLMSIEPPSVLQPLQPLAANAAKALEGMTEAVVERIDEALLSLTEQRVVRPLYAIGGAVAVRAMIVPGVILFLVGVWFGMSSDDIRKSFPKSPAIVAAATAPTVAALPEVVTPTPAPTALLEEPEPQPATTADAPETDEAAPAAPRRTARQRAIQRRRARARAVARARVAQRARARRRARARNRR